MALKVLKSWIMAKKVRSTEFYALIYKVEGLSRARNSLPKLFGKLSMSNVGMLSTRSADFIRI